MTIESDNFHKTLMKYKKFYIIIPKKNFVHKQVLYFVLFDPFF
jgi:hypothetical protein